MKKSMFSVEQLSKHIPTGATVIDAVTTSKFQFGAVLVRYENTGIYALVSDTIVYTCDQREAKDYVAGEV